MSSTVLKLKLPTCIQPEVMPQPGKEGVYTNQMHYIKKHLLDELTKKKFAQDFLQPVDTEELQIPNYYKVIHRPMDLGTMRKRVENNYYQDVEGVIQDFHQIIRNCRQFNGENSITYRKAIQLEKFFQRVMGNFPNGPPVPCNKDPGPTTRATTSNTTNPMEMSMEETCRQQLNQLKTATNQADAVARNFFGPKWESFSKKLDKKSFKSVEDFRSQVDGLIRKYHEPAKMIYEKVYDQPGGYPGDGDAHSIPISSPPDFDVEALIGVLKTTEHSLMQCVQRPQRGKSLVEGFRDSVAGLKRKLKDIQTQDSPNDGDEDSMIDKYEAGSSLRSAKGAKLQDEVPNGDISDDELRVENIDEAQRRNIQMKFSNLPVSDMREILTMVDSNEGITRDAQNNLSFDLKSFKPVNAQIMKEGVTKSLKMANKVKLRNMQPEEKEGLRCNLETKLSDITQSLGQSRRKNAAAPLTSDKNTGDQKRGRKRANSKSPPSQVSPRRRPARIRGISPLPATPELPTCSRPAGRAPRPGGSASFQGGRVPVKPGPQGEGGSASIQGGRVPVKPGPQEPKVKPGLPKPTFYSPPRSAQGGARAAFQGGRTAKTLGSPEVRKTIQRGHQVGRTPKTPTFPVGRNSTQRVAFQGSPKTPFFPGGQSPIKRGYKTSPFKRRQDFHNRQEFIIGQPKQNKKTQRKGKRDDQDSLK